MAFYLLPAYSGGCCPVCPPPGSCSCDAVLDCLDCVPGAQELDENCDPILADTDGDGIGDTPIDIVFEACTPAVGTDYETFEADHPGGSGWVVISGCNSCNTCDSTPTIFVSESVAAGNTFTVEVDLVALTNTGQAQVKATAWDCLCQGDNGVDIATVSSSGGTTGSGVVTGRREVGGTNNAGGACNTAVTIECESIPNDCCGWKLAYKITTVALPDDCCDPSVADGYDTFEADFPSGSGWVHLNATQITSLLLLAKTGDRLTVGSVPCGERRSLDVAIASTSTSGITLTAYADAYNCGTCSAGEESTSVIGSCSAAGSASVGPVGTNPLYGEGDGALELGLSAVNDCCALKIAYRISTVGLDEAGDITQICVPNFVADQYCTIDGVNQVHYVDLTPQNLCCVDPSRLSVGYLSCSSPDCAVSCGSSGLTIAITPSGGGAFSGPTTVSIDYDITVAGGADCACDDASPRTVDDGGFPFTTEASIDPANCCTENTALGSFNSYTCSNVAQDCSTRTQQGRYDGFASSGPGEGTFLAGVTRDIATSPLIFDFAFIGCDPRPLQAVVRHQSVLFGLPTGAIRTTTISSIGAGPNSLHWWRYENTFSALFADGVSWTNTRYIVDIVVSFPVAPEGGYDVKGSVT